jgi:hypothetical protein
VAAIRDADLLAGILKLDAAWEPTANEASGSPDIRYKTAMLNLSCLCGQIRIEVARRPDFINECNCTLCSKSGARWSYFRPSEVSIEGATRKNSREDKDDPAAEIHFCGRCGSTTHFTESARSKFGNVQTGVNMSLADESDLVGIELRYPDGRAWSGGADFGYVWEPRVIGQSVKVPRGTHPKI